MSEHWTTRTTAGDRGQETRARRERAWTRGARAVAGALLALAGATPAGALTLTKGSIGPCYKTGAEAEAAAKAATTASTDCPPVTLVARASPGCIARVTVTGTDTCEGSASVEYITCTDGTNPVAAGQLSPCLASDAAALQEAQAKATCTDNCTLRPPDRKVEPAGPGQIRVTCTDTCGNVGTATLSYTLAGGPPVLTKGTLGPCYKTAAEAQAAAIAATTVVPATATTSAIVEGTCVAAVRVSATSPCGQSASVEYSTSVTGGKPVFSGVPADVTVECGAPLPSGAPTVTDPCDPKPAVEVAEAKSAGKCAGTQIVTRTWTARNRCGGTATAKQVITVVDSRAPVLSGVPPDGRVAGCALPPAPTTVVAKDECDPRPQVTLAQTDDPAGSCAGAIRTWTARDACGNVATGRQALKFESPGAPVLAGVPPDATVECGALPAAAKPTAKDACDPAPVIAFKEGSAPGACPDGSTVTRTWTATNRCGGSTTARQVLTVRDSKPPQIAGVPANATLACGAPVPPAPTLTAKDACDPAPKVVPTEQRTPGPGTCAANFRVERTWTATDRCGNKAEAKQVITSADTQPPTVTPAGDLACLWPPNHWYVCFTADDLKATAKVADNCGATGITWRFAGCSSNQPDNANEERTLAGKDPFNGDGNTVNDCVVDPGGKWLCVRAERAGGGATAQAGRRYGIQVVATDACGNSSTPLPLGSIFVPHDQSPQTSCLQTTQVGCGPNGVPPCGKAGR